MICSCLVIVVERLNSSMFTQCFKAFMSIKTIFSDYVAISIHISLNEIKSTTQILKVGINISKCMTNNLLLDKLA
ncbi:CLUMA_CG007807, isoform A, partial [Clunio marinus]